MAEILRPAIFTNVRVTEENLEGTCDIIADDILEKFLPHCSNDIQFPLSMAKTYGDITVTASMIIIADSDLTFSVNLSYENCPHEKKCSAVYVLETH